MDTRHERFLQNIDEVYAHAKIMLKHGESEEEVVKYIRRELPDDFITDYKHKFL
jgi:1,2-phenylacetyl-CoA epoxidase catalytic subunit